MDTLNYIPNDQSEAFQDSFQWTIQENCNNSVFANWLDKISFNKLWKIFQFLCYSSITSFYRILRLTSVNFVISLNIIIETVADPER